MCGSYDLFFWSVYVTFMGAQIAPKSLSAGASPQIPLGELTALSQTP